MKPLISIIIPSYNQGDKIEQLLKSIFNQVYENYQVIIIDAGSSDNTNLIIQKYKSNIFYTVSEKDNGIFDAMNKGIIQSTGEWLYFIGCDDTLYDNHVLNSIFGNNVYLSEKIIVGKIFNIKKNKTEGNPIIHKSDLFHNQIYHQSVFYHKDIFKSIGLYEIKYKIAADSIFNISLFCKFNFKWLYLDIIVSKYSGTGVSSNAFDRVFHENQKELLFDWFSDLPKNKVYDGLQYHMYNEIRYGNILKALKEFLLIIWHTKSISPYIRNTLYWLKRRILTK